MWYREIGLWLAGRVAGYLIVPPGDIVPITSADIAAGVPSGSCITVSPVKAWRLALRMRAREEVRS